MKGAQRETGWIGLVVFAAAVVTLMVVLPAYADMASAGVGASRAVE